MNSRGLRIEYEELKRAKDQAEEDTIFSFQKKKGCQAERKQVKEQKEEAERFKQKQAELEDLKTESYLVQIFHINKVRWVNRWKAQCGGIDRE